MKNSNNQISGKFEKCPYQILAYGENNCEVIYRTSYKGDWGDWDEPVKNVPSDLSDAEGVLN